MRSLSEIKAINSAPQPDISVNDFLRILDAIGSMSELKRLAKEYAETGDVTVTDEMRKKYLA